MSGPPALCEAVFVTGNPGKLAEARRLCGADLESVTLDLPEIQSLDLDAVLRAKAEEAWRRLRRPILVEETGLELAALGGFPGPLVKWMLSAAGPEGLARTAAGLGDRRATARCALLLRGEEGALIGRGEVPGWVVLPPRGAGGFGWDPVFVPDGSTRTYAEMSTAEKDRASHRALAWRDLRRQLGEAPSP